jgi:hypothetical protein
MVVGVRDKTVLGATDTFAAEQGADGEAAEELYIYIYIYIYI